MMLNGEKAKTFFLRHKKRDNCQRVFKRSIISYAIKIGVRIGETRGASASGRFKKTKISLSRKPLGS
jgi:hypothetical protein